MNIGSAWGALSKPALVVLACTFAVAGASAEVSPLNSPEALNADGFRDVFAKVADGVFMAGQPSEAGLQRVKGLGVTRVINLRTHQEMDNREVVPYDEAAAIEALGMEYVHIPLGGPDTPYSPEAVTQLADALRGAEGNVLLHCTVAWRASHLWAAYLVAEHGYSVADAVNVGKQLNMGGYPFAEFLDREVSLAPKGEPAQ